MNNPIETVRAEIQAWVSAELAKAKLDAEIGALEVIAAAIGDKLGDLRAGARSVLDRRSPAASDRHPDRDSGILRDGNLPGSDAELAGGKRRTGDYRGGEMTVQHIEIRIKQEIENIADDPENAHSNEDQLRRDVLDAIAAGAINAQELAAAVIKTADIAFERWYA